MKLYDFTFKVFTPKSSIPLSLVKVRYETLKQAIYSIQDKFPNHKYQLIHCEQYCQACA